MNAKPEAKDVGLWIRFTVVILNLIGCEELYSKHFKTHYNGKPARRYLRIINQIKKAERFTDSDIKRLFLS